MTAQVYDLHGLRVRSEIPLPEPAVASDQFDLDVRWGATATVPVEPPPGEVVAASAAGPHPLYTATDDGERYVLRVHRVCDMVLSSDLASIECRPDPRWDARFIPILLAGTAVAFVLELAGHCVLHGAAIEADGSAMAFVGRSGTGKSTLAALLCAAGAGLITDDVLRLDLGDEVVCVGGCSELRLRPAAAWIVESYQPRPALRQTADDRVAVKPVGASVARPRLKAIVVPRASRNGDDLRVTRVPQAAALFQLLGAARIAGWRLPRIVCSQFQSLSSLADSVPVLEAEIPWEAPSPPDLACRLLDRLTDLESISEERR